MPTAFKKVTTLTDFILEEEKKSSNAHGNLTLLLTHIENVSKIIASHLKESGLVDILGKTGSVNSYGDEVAKLDEYANQLLIDTLLNSGQVYAVASEELDKEIYSKDGKGEYVVFFDPLDGSSNIDVNIPAGTIFSIYHKSDSLFQPGTKQVAAGYVLYSTSVMFVYTTGNGVNGFTLDPSIGSFLLSHPNITIPEKGSVYAINEGSHAYFEESTVNYLTAIKEKKSYKLRYSGAMVADVHRILLQGGVFLYPGDKKNPSGKLRLLFEVNPMSFLITQAGGLASTGNSDPMHTVPTAVDAKSPIIMGSKEEVEYYISFVK